MQTEAPMNDHQSYRQDFVDTVVVENYKYRKKYYVLYYTSA